MTLFDLVEEVQEKTHLGELEILDRGNPRTVIIVRTEQEGLFQ